MINPDNYKSNFAKLAATALNAENENRPLKEYIEYLHAFIKKTLSNEEWKRFEDPTDEFGVV